MACDGEAVRIDCGAHTLHRVLHLVFQLRVGSHTPCPTYSSSNILCTIHHTTHRSGRRKDSPKLILAPDRVFCAPMISCESREIIFCQMQSCRSAKLLLLFSAVSVNADQQSIVILDAHPFIVYCSSSTLSLLHRRRNLERTAHPARAHVVEDPESQFGSPCTVSHQSSHPIRAPAAATRRARTSPCRSSGTL